MAGLPLLPDSAPFAAEQIAALNHVMSATNIEQRSWLSGFLAGFQAANTQPAAVPAAAATRKIPLAILFATESGNAEVLAAQARKAATKLGFAPRVLDMADVTAEQLAKLPNVLVIASTWGEGEPPQRGADLHAALIAGDAPRLEGVRFAVLALGDRAYAQFCEIGRQFDDRLEALGATRICTRIDCDLDFEAPATAWLGNSLLELKKVAGDAEPDAAVIHVDFAREAPDEPTYSRGNPFEAEITEHTNLSGSRSTGRTFHVELSLEGSGIAYEPGDAIGFVPTNNPKQVEAVLSAVGLGGDSDLHARLAHQFDISTLTRPQIVSYRDITGSAALAEIARDEASMAAFIPGRQVIDLLTTAPHHLSANQLLGLLRPLPPRLYSVASSQKAVEQEAHLLIADVAYETHGRARRGVASSDIADRRAAGQTLKIYVKPNPHFRLPVDPTGKIILIGPGTGVAPFRGFLQEREAVGATGSNWLFFGSRNYMQDFLYQLEFQDWLKSGVLTNIDVAFSRDQAEKVYVQHRIWQRRAELFRWIEDGAAIYVCGDGQAMAKDVHAMLLRVIADQSGRDADAATAYLDGLRRGGRYLRDVY